jgi:hypothetical protein
MSKVKAIPGIKKQKLIAKMRRRETAMKKKDRLNKVIGDVYSYGKGYFIHEGKYINHYKNTYMPEHTKIEKSYTKVYTYKLDEDGNIVKGVKYRPVAIEKVIPACTIRNLIDKEYVSLPKRPIRINTSNVQKYCKKLTSRKLRRRPIDELYNNGSYKRLVDLEWELW